MYVYMYACMYVCMYVCMYSALCVVSDITVGSGELHGHFLHCICVYVCMCVRERERENVFCLVCRER